MKKSAIAFLAASALSCFAQSHYVQPHVTQNGNYVQGHYQSNPNGTKLDNYSTQGNTNPYTGQSGTVDPYRQPSYQQPTYQQPPANYGQQQCGINQYGQYVCH
jgi:hypothetical protein